MASASSPFKPSPINTDLVAHQSLAHGSSIPHLSPVDPLTIAANPVVHISIASRCRQHDQAKHARDMLHFLEGTLDTMELPHVGDSSRFTIADLGCSCGANTLITVDAMLDHVRKMYEALGCEMPEFQVFFSDLPSNDFNTLFHLLPPLAGESPEERLASAEGRRPAYYAAGVPGSFYGRLFPARSINVFHSAFSLHWLSQIPARVADEQSDAYNNGRVFIHGAPEHVANAYKLQFQADLASFLGARALEMKEGGAMFLFCLGRTSPNPSDQIGAGLFFGRHFEDAWDDLIKEGLLESDKRDSFNIPVYGPSLEEFREVVEANGSFAINKLEVFKASNPLAVSHPDDAFEVGQLLANTCRAAVGVLVDAHIGEQLSEELFARFKGRAVLKNARELMEQLQLSYIVASLSLA